MITVIFNLTDSAGYSTDSLLYISPLNAPFSYSGSIISAKTIVLDENGSGTIELVPTAYTVRETGYEGGTQFIFDLSTVTDGTTVNVANYIVTETPVPSLITGLYTGIYSNPNSYIVPANPNVAAQYYQDVGYPNVWLWSVSSQDWFQLVGP